MIKVYIVDGVRYNVGPAKEKDFLTKFPNAVFLEDKEEPGKPQAVATKGASVTAQPPKAPGLELSSEKLSLDLAYKLPENLKVSSEESESIRQRYIQEAEKGPVEEFKEMSFKEYRESGLMKPEEEKFYIGSGAKRVKITKQPYDSFLTEAKKRLGEDASEVAINEKAKALFVENSIEDYKVQKVENYLRDEAGIFYESEELEAFKNINKSQIKDLQVSLEKDIQKNSEIFSNINKELVDVVSKATEIQNKKYTSNKEYQEAKKLFQEYRDVATSLAKLAAKKHDALMSSAKTYEDNQQFLDIFKREYSDIKVLGGGTLASATSIVGGLFKLPEWLTVSIAEAVGEGRGARAAFKLYGSLMPGTKLGDEALNFAEKVSANIAKPIDVTDIDSVSDAFSWSANLVGSQIPIMATLMAAGPAGLGVISASATGQKYETMAKEIDAGLEGYNAAQLLFAPIAVGLGEFVSESFTLGKLTGVKNIFKKNVDAVAAAKKYIQENITKPRFVVDVAGEALSEGFATMAENLTDIYMLDKEKSVWEGVPNALASGAFMSSVIFNMPVAAARLARPFTDFGALREQLNNNLNQINEIEKSLENKDLDTTAKKSLRDAIDTIYKDNTKIVAKIYNDVEDFTTEETEQLISIDIEIGQIEAKAKLFADMAGGAEKAKSIIDPLNERYKVLNNQLKKIHNEARLRKSPYRDLTKEQKEEEFNKDAQRLKTLSSQIPNSTIKVFEDGDQAANWLLNNTNKTIEQIAGVAYGSYGFFVKDNNGIDTGVLIKGNALQNEKNAILTTGLHEGFHLFLGNATANSLTFSTDVGLKLYGFLEKNLNPTAFGNTEFYKRFQGYKKEFDKGEITASNFMEEVFPLLSESLEKGDIKFQETFFSRLGDFFRRLFQSMGLRDIEFKSGRDVFNFVRDYNKSFKEGKLTKAQLKFATGERVITRQDLASEELKASAKLTEEENQEVTDLFSTNIERLYRYKPYNNLIQAVANSITKKYFDPIPDDARVGVDRSEYLITAQGDLTNITREWKPEVQPDFGKFIANRGFLRLKSLASDLGIESTEEFGGVGIIADVETSKEAMRVEEEAAAAVPTGKMPKQKKEIKDAFPLTAEVNGVPIIDTINTKLEKIVRLATKKINAQITKNVNVTPFIRDVKNELADQLRDDIVSVMMNYPTGVQGFLRDTRATLLTNYTTTYMSRHPLYRKGIEKSVGGKRTFDKQGRATIEPNWISPVKVGENEYNFRDARGQKFNRLAFDRKSGIGTGKTSGEQFIRRNPDILNVITEEEFINQHYTSPNRQFVYELGVEATARQIASEMGLEILKDDLRKKGPIYERLAETADILDIAVTETLADDLTKDIQRGDVKLSKKAKDIIETESAFDDLLAIAAAHHLAPETNLTYALQQSLYPELQEQDAVDTHNAIKRSLKDSEENLDMPKGLTDVARLDQMLVARGIPLEEMSEVTAAVLYGEKLRNKLRFFVPPNSDDFMGLMYYMLRKGPEGERDLKWIKENIITPYSKGIAAFNTYKEDTMNKYREFKSRIRKTPAKLKAVNASGFTNEQSVRVYLWATSRTPEGQKIDIPGLSRDKIKKILAEVRKNEVLLSFAINLKYLTPEGYPLPTEDWFSKSITIDILEDINERSRRFFLQEFIVKSEEAFGKIDSAGKLKGPMANKLLAAFGKDYVDALGDVLYRMRVGRSRRFGGNKEVSQFDSWINGSVGAIMFLNTRSAILQFISLINYINYTDNNPIKVGAAVANLDQLVKDIEFILNSDLLRQRRSGLQLDINYDEIAQIAERGGNSPRAIISAVLKKGFVLTQYADSFAIAIGGAPFYRNRINTYLKDGLSQKEAEEKAFLDFQEITEESQQSSRPDRISKIQAGPLGRLIFAFGNTPFQYARLTKKAALDLINNRGDWKSNMTKLLYYGAVQNIIFTSIQSALFTLLYDDDDDELNDKEKDKIFNVLNGALDSFLRGAGIAGAIGSVSKNIVLKAVDEAKQKNPDYTDIALESLKISPPIQSKISKGIAAGRLMTWRQERKKMREEGFAITNPAYEVIGKTLSATINLPVDRVVEKLSNINLIIEQENGFWAELALAFGWKDYQLGMNESKKAIGPSFSKKRMNKNKFGKSKL